MGGLVAVHAAAHLAAAAHAAACLPRKPTSTAAARRLRHHWALLHTRMGRRNKGSQPACATTCKSVRPGSGD